jgi:hypothetical protein
MTNKTNDTIYIVYSQDESHFDDWSENTYQLKEHWFTDEEQAELCAEYLNMSDSTFGYFSVAEVTNGDDIDYKSLIKEEERKEKERQLLLARNLREKNVENLAAFQSRILGGDYGETLKELKEKYADYIEGKEQ